jgi:hypothetical protein
VYLVVAAGVQEECAGDGLRRRPASGGVCAGSVRRVGQVRSEAVPSGASEGCRGRPADWRVDLYAAPTCPGKAKGGRAGWLYVDKEV